ncbi:MAG TPA: baseplate J/gp47 family protein, partial [Pyrinomonadaceae bacterium]|nr:baseplate J/gp47 family protein [Pyrinomonadaceae bacterium]
PLKSATVEYFLAENFEVWAGAEQKSSSSVIFLARESQRVHQLVNSMSLYTWGDAIPSLLAGDTSADLKIWLVDINDFATDKASAIAVQELIRSGTIKRLLIQEHLNPATGTVNGYNPHKRQLLELLPGNDGAEAMYDPTTAPAGYDPAADPPNSAGQGQWFVRVRWEERDKLKSNYCFIVDCPDTGKVENVSLFHGNLVEVTHGRSRFADPAKLLPKDQPVDDRQVIFKEPTESLTDSNQFHFERTERWGALCPLPDYNIAYLNTPPGGDVPPQSTLQVTVVQNGGGSETWREVPSLIHSDDSDENGAHFIVETDEEGLSYVRFGSGTNGKELPENATVTCAYQVGNGLEGNIGFDTLIHFNPAANNFLKLDNKNPQPKDTSSIIGCWNPFDITNGRSPEPAAEIIRRAPEAYRIRQLRAVTLQDYIRRAEELPEVSRAAARYSWTGSWRTVRITIDPAGTNVLEEDLRRKIARYLDAVRLIGEDLEIRPPQFVPLEIHVSLCAKPDFWPEDLRSILEQEFSDGWTPDGRMGFFHPDLWTFGQSLMASQITDRVLRVAGVEHIISVTMKRWNYPTSATTEITDVAYNEIIQVLNDPDHMEQGFIDFDVRGGRR